MFLKRILFLGKKLNFMNTSTHPVHLPNFILDVLVPVAKPPSVYNEYGSHKFIF